jgi:predicted RNase H-like nuclease
MSETSQKVWLAGVDGCPGGWVAVFVRSSGDEFILRTYEAILDVADGPMQPAVIAVDMPIGLPDRSGIGGRAAENAVRPLLGKRQSSVFSVPSRAAIFADSYAQACATALATSDPPRKVSKQLFNIAPKIREIDGLLQTHPQWRPRFFEVHPEVAFWRLNGEQPLQEPKKVKSRTHAPGLDMRRKLLIAAGLPTALVHANPPKPAKADDLIDACACAAIARRIYSDTAKPFPDPPPCDAHGLPMAIWA